MTEGLLFAADLAEDEYIDPDDENPFRYCGEYYDKGTNRLYLRARDYDASTGRFTSEDPIGDSLNWYAYCENNPLVNIHNGKKLTTAMKDAFRREALDVFKGSENYQKALKEAIKKVINFKCII